MNGNRTPGIIFGIPIRKILYSAIAVLLLLIIVLAAAIVRNRTESGEYRNLRQSAQEYFDAGKSIRPYTSMDNIPLRSYLNELSFFIFFNLFPILLKSAKIL